MIFWTFEAFTDFENEEAKTNAIHIFCKIFVDGHQTVHSCKKKRLNNLNRTCIISPVWPDG